MRISTTVKVIAQKMIDRWNAMLDCLHIQNKIVTVDEKREIDLSDSKSKTQKTVKAILRELAPISEDFDKATIKDVDYIEMRLDREQIPVPELILFTMKDLLGIKIEGPFEKVRWSILATYRRYPVRFELRKMGFAIECPEIIAEEIMQKLNSSNRVLAGQFLSKFCEYQARRGQVSLLNKYPTLRDSYLFFRQKAKEAFAAPPPPAEQIVSADGSIVGQRWHWRKNEKEGANYAIAMINSFFGMLEHLLVLCAPFMGFQPADGRLVSLIGAQWGQKYKLVFDMSTDHEAKRFYDRLREIKEEYRNPQAHGGFEREWWSMYFHLPGVGALPAKLVNHKYSFEPVSLMDFEDICRILDEFETFLNTGKSRYGIKFANAGLNVSFGDNSILEYQDAMKSDKDFEAFLDHEAYEADRHTNMEY